jgi:hypothetical protein
MLMGEDLVYWVSCYSYSYPGLVMAVLGGLEGLGQYWVEDR